MIILLIYPQQREKEIVQYIPETSKHSCYSDLLCAVLQPAGRLWIVPKL